MAEVRGVGRNLHPWSQACGSRDPERWMKSWHIRVGAPMLERGDLMGKGANEWQLE